MQLMDAQHAASTKLQVQAKQSQTVQMAHTDALRTLAKSTKRRNIECIFSSIPMLDISREEDFLSGLKD